jgi:hypothetical protein
VHRKLVGKVEGSERQISSFVCFVTFEGEKTKYDGRIRNN